MVTPSLPGFASWWCEADEGNIESRKARARHRQPESTLSFSLGWQSELRWEAAYKSVGRAATPSQSAGGRHMAGRETGTETDGQKREDWGKIDGKTRSGRATVWGCVCVRVCVCRQVSVCFHGKECCGQAKPLQYLIISLPTSNNMTQRAICKKHNKGHKGDKTERNSGLRSVGWHSCLHAGYCN